MNWARFLSVPFLILLLASLPMFAGTIHAEESGSPATAEGGSAATEMARKLQNPLANIKALSTDNAVGFDTGNNGGTSYGVQIQPVYAIDFSDRGFTLIPRAVIPLLGLEPRTDEESEHAYLSIRNRDHWYWIDDRDMNSKRSFAFLMLLFSLAETGKKGPLPLITIPVQ